jgi:hypothetical protein
MVDICWTAIDKLAPNGGNARTHSRKQIRQIADSIAAFGFVVPILIDDDSAHDGLRAELNMVKRRCECRLRDAHSVCPPP